MVPLQKFSFTQIYRNETEAVILGIIPVKGVLLLLTSIPTCFCLHVLHVVSDNSLFTVVRLVTKPLNRSEARVDFVVIQTLFLSLCKSLCYHAN